MDAGCHSIVGLPDGPGSCDYLLLRSVVGALAAASHLRVARLDGRYQTVQRELQRPAEGSNSSPPGSKMTVSERLQRQAATFLVTALFVSTTCFLAVRALKPDLMLDAHWSVGWFGAPGSWLTILVVVLILALVCLRIGRRIGHGDHTANLVAISVMAFTAFVLGFASFFRCSGDQSAFFAPLTWTLGLFVGNLENIYQNGSGVCTAQMPLALEVARLLALAATVFSFVAVALEVFKTQRDRVRAWLSKRVTVIVAIDDDTLSMVTAISQSMDSKSALVILTQDRDRPCVKEARRSGACILTVDLQSASGIKNFTRLWPKIERLYLLSDDAALNRVRLAAIDQQLDELGFERIRIPLIVRIDDPWQAEEWRGRYKSNSTGRWLVDAVGKFEETASRIIEHAIADSEVEVLYVCGLSPLTLALCSEFAQRKRERDFHPTSRNLLSRLVIVAEGAEEWVEDHVARQRRFSSSGPDGTVTYDDRPASIKVLSELVATTGAAKSAVILVRDEAPGPSMGQTSLGTRLAARLRTVAIFSDGHTASGLERSPVMGKLHTYSITMKMLEGRAQDAWERAARLIHEHYSAGRTNSAAVPWEDLPPFYRESNRRALRNALWIAELHGGHSWDPFEGRPPAPLPANFMALEPLGKLAALGFDCDTAKEMAREEHEDWCRYYERSGWKYRSERDDSREQHDKLLAWNKLTDHDRSDAYNNLVSIFVNLRTLGYVSTPRGKTDAHD